MVNAHETSLVIKEMQIKTTMRYRVTLMMVAIIRKQKQNQKITSVGEIVEKLKCCPSLVGMWNDAATVENGMVIP